MTGPVHAAALAVAACLSLLAGSACRAVEPAAAFTHTLPTKEAAAEAVLQALWERNPAKLQALAISEVEYRKYVWSALPASRAAVGMPLDYAWSDISVKSRGELALILETFGGRRFTLEAVRFAGRSVDYGAFRVHGKTELTVRNETGVRSTVRVCGSMIETAIGWKIYSYTVD